MNLTLSALSISSMAKKPNTIQCMAIKIHFYELQIFINFIYETKAIYTVSFKILNSQSVMQLQLNRKAFCNA